MQPVSLGICGLDYTYEDETFEIIPVGDLIYSERSKADLSHTATFGITSPTMENLSLSTPGFSSLLIPQNQAILAGGGGPDSVNAPQNVSSPSDPSVPSAPVDNTTVSVPEPSTITMFISALFMLRLTRK